MMSFLLPITWLPKKLGTANYKMSKWKTLSEKTVYTTSLFKVKKKEFELPNGSKRSYSIIERESASMVFPLDKDGNIYLLRQYRYIFDTEIIEAVAGYIDKGEKSLDTAKRELKEEAGIIARKWDKLVESQGSSSVIKMDIELFLAQDLSFERATPTESEQIELVKMPVGEAVKKVLSGEIKNSPTVIGILMIDKLKQTGKI